MKWLFLVIITLICTSCYSGYMIDAGCDPYCAQKLPKWGGQARGVRVDGECHCEPVDVKWWH